MVIVLVVAAGAGWEPGVVQRLGDHPGILVLKRCVDVDDLLAAASAGQAGVAVVGIDAPGLDAAAVEHLRRHGVRPVAVVPEGSSPEAARTHAGRIGIAGLVDERDLDQLPQTVLAVEAEGVEPAGPVEEVSGRDPGDPRGLQPAPTFASPATPGRLVAVWGPAGAPGRSTVAAAVAGELARRREATVLVDADPYGGALAQQLGVLDEISGLLSAARLASTGRLREQVASVQRRLGEHLTVVTGLPRADRWAEVRSGALETLLETTREQGHVVVDTGFCLEEDPGSELGSRPGRNTMTTASLELADEVVVVGSADPVGLSRLARGLVELRELRGGLPVHVVVNRMRPGLGWSEHEVAGMIGGFTRLAGLHFLPDDRAGVDKALVAGRLLVEVGDSALSRAVAGLVDAVVPVAAAAPPPSGQPPSGQPVDEAPGAGRDLRPRTAGTTRRR